MLFSEPKIPQFTCKKTSKKISNSFSALQRAENSSIGEREDRYLIQATFQCSSASRKSSIDAVLTGCAWFNQVSVLFSEPKILNCASCRSGAPPAKSFSALQRAENPQFERVCRIPVPLHVSFSALQRAEIAEIVICVYTSPSFQSFSALQRAEIAEISDARSSSVAIRRFSALQRAEIAEIHCMVCII